MTDASNLFYLLTTLFIVSGFIFRRSSVLFYFQILWMIILCGGNTGAQDFSINETMYNLAGVDGDLEDYGLLYFAYYITRMISYNMGLSFTEYNMIMATSSILILAYIAQKYSKNFNVVISLIYLYPFAEMVIQKRFLPAMSLIVVALLFLYNKAIKNRIKFALIVLLAIGFHSSVIFFMLFLILEIIFYDDNMKSRKYILILLLILEISCINLLPFLLLNIFPDDKIQLYFFIFAESANIYTCLFWSMLQGTMILLMYKVYSVSPKTKWSDLIYRLNMYSIYIMPLYIFDPVFMRFYRPIMILNYIYFSELLPEHIKITKREIWGGFGIIIISLLFSIIWYYCGIGNMTFERMIMPIFKNNLFLY